MIFDGTTSCRRLKLRQRKQRFVVICLPRTCPFFPRSPEHMSSSLARYLALLQRDGLSEPQALTQIDRTLGLDVFPQGHAPQGLPQYLAPVLARYYPNI